VAITRETLTAAANLRKQIRQLTDDQATELVTAWVAAWDALQEDFEEALDELMKLGGTFLSPQQMARNQRLADALAQAESALEELFQTTRSLVARDALLAVQDTVEGQQRLINSQLPTPDPTGPYVQVNLNAPAPEALNAIVLRTTQQVESLTDPLPKWVAAKMKAELVRGIVIGENPRAVARRMLKSTEDQFNGGLGRAMNIARTEMLDAHRYAARASDLANLDVITGWRWSAQLDSRTCSSCATRHGDVFPPGQFGPEDHPMGRCARIPVIKSWKELGFGDIPEPEDAFPDAKVWYDNLTEDSQRAMMGPTRQRLLEEGKVDWKDLSTKQKNPGWRDSYNATSVKELLAMAGEE